MPEPAAPSFLPRWGLGDVLAAVAVGLVASSVLIGIWSGLSGESGTDRVGVIVAGELGLWAGFVGVPFLASRQKGAGRMAVDFGLRARLVDLPTGIGAGLLGQVVVAVVVVGLREIVGRNRPAQQVLDTAKHAGGLSQVVIALVVVVAVPVAEELFFRGLLLRSLERRAGRPVAVIVSALGFGVAHIGGSSSGSGAVELTLFLALAAFGVLQALLAVRTGRLGPGIVSHGTFNALTLLLAS